MMEKIFNLSRYKELLKLEKSGKISFLDLELLSYRVSVAHQICYTRKKDYFILIDGYFSGIISPFEFRSKFLQMKKEDSEKSTTILEELEVFTLANDLENFSALIDQISTLCFEYDEVWDGTMERMAESEFYALVNNCYLQLQKAFSFENFNNQAYNNLVSCSFNFLMVTVALLLILINIRPIT